MRSSHSEFGLTVMKPRLNMRKQKIEPAKTGRFVKPVTVKNQERVSWANCDETTTKHEKTKD